METGKFHNLLSVRWRNRKAGDAIQSEFEGLRMGMGAGCQSRAESKSPGTRCASVPGRRREKMEGCLSSNGESKFGLTLPVCSTEAHSGLAETRLPQSTDSDANLSERLT